MDTHTINMTSGKPLKLLIKFAIPMMLGNICQQLYTVVDTAVVGRGLGVDALAALGASGWIYGVVLGIMLGLTQGFAILITQSYGAAEYDHLRKVFAHSIILTIISTAVLVALSQLALEPVLVLMQTPSDIMPGTMLYLRVMFAGIPISMAYNLLAGTLRSIGDSNTPFHAMIISSVVNVVLDLLFVLVFHWGIAGAGVATLIAQLTVPIYCYIRIRKLDFLLLSKGDFKLDFHLSGKLFSLGLPLIFQSTIISIGGMILQTVINKAGTLFIAGYTATGKLFGLLEMAALSYGYAMVTYVGQNFGAKKYQHIRQGVRAGIWLGLATAVVIMAIMLVFGKPFLSLFISADPAEAAQTLEIAYQYLTILSICLPILYILHVLRNALQGMGKTVLTMLSGVLEFVMRTGTALVLPLFIGDAGIFFAEVMAWTGADMVLVVSYLVTIHKIKKLHPTNIENTEI